MQPETSVSGSGTVERKKSKLSEVFRVPATPNRPTQVSTPNPRNSFVPSRTPQEEQQQQPKTQQVEERQLRPTTPNIRNASSTQKQIWNANETIKEIEKFLEENPVHPDGTFQNFIALRKL